MHFLLEAYQSLNLSGKPAGYVVLQLRKRECSFGAHLLNIVSFDNCLLQLLTWFSDMARRAWRIWIYWNPVVAYAVYSKYPLFSSHLVRLSLTRHKSYFWVPMFWTTSLRLVLLGKVFTWSSLLSQSTWSYQSWQTASAACAWPVPLWEQRRGI